MSCSLELLDRGAELLAEPLLGLLAGAELVEPEQRRADDRRRPRLADSQDRRDLAQLRLDGVREPSVGRLEEAAAEEELRRLLLELEPLERDVRESGHLGGYAGDDLGGHGVVVGLREDDRRKLGDPAQRDLLAVDRLRERGRGLEAEVRGHRLLERRLRPAAVLAARGRGHRRQADVVAAAPVPGDRAERGEAGVPPVRRDADAVDPGPADDGDAPAALGSRAQDCEGVVADARPLRPTAARYRGAELLLLAREVDARHEQLRDRRDGAVARAAGVAGRLVEQALEHVERAVEPEVVRRAERPADERKHLAVGADEREVGLRVAAVYGENQLVAHAVTSRGN